MFALPYTGDHYSVVDNTFHPEGGADTNKSVIFSLTVKLYFHSESDSSEDALGFEVVGAIAAVSGLVTSIASKKKEI